MCERLLSKGRNPCILIVRENHSMAALPAIKNGLRGSSPMVVSECMPKTVALPRRHTYMHVHNYILCVCEKLLMTDIFTYDSLSMSLSSVSQCVKIIK